MSGPSGGGGGDWRPTSESRPTTRSGSDASGSGTATMDPCDIDTTLPLNSPNQAVLNRVIVGDILGVQLIPGPPMVLVASTASGDVVGSITAAQMAQLIACIRQGVTYQAEVKVIRGGLCQVRVTRV